MTNFENGENLIADAERSQKGAKDILVWIKKIKDNQLKGKNKE